jgi:serine/threonine protein kinase
MPHPSGQTSHIKPSAGLYDLALAEDETLDGATGDVASSMDTPGMTIAGRYVLKSILGDGGTGHVWCAEQTQPVRREVAIKIIRSGLVMQPVSARFNREHQVLARLEHPHIAAVFDAGELPDGRTYFVMEVVSGAPITTWCKQHETSLRERLQIFLQACQAVQHAHQKGILHRDIKPSNVMVTLVDGQPRVKVIDFGIAKALEGDLSMGADMTLRGMVLGTPRYMSPEQAGLTGQDVDTRADVYALGVLLYELLTSTTPIQAVYEKDETLPELLHRVRQTEIELPSRRVAHLANEIKFHACELRGELDWIVMRALEKDREQRYPTVLSFAEDIHRYLLDEPVIAAPPGTAYRLKKWFIRHRQNLTAAAAVIVSLAGGIAATSWALKQEEKQRLEAVQLKQSAQQQTDLARQVSAQLNELLSNARKHAEAGMNTQMLRNLADECAAGMSRFADQPGTEAELAEKLALLYTALEERSRSLPWFQRHWELLKKTEGELSRKTLEARYSLGWRSLSLNKRELALEHLRAVVEDYKKLPDADDAILSRALVARKELARALSMTGRHDEAISLFAEVMQEKGESRPWETAAWLREQADVYRVAGRLNESAAALQHALDLIPKDEKYAGLRAYIFGSVATTSQMREHYDEALNASAERLRLFEAEHGENHPKVLNALIDHALLACKCPGCPGGEDAARRALLIAQTAAHESRLADAWIALSETLRITGRLKESEKVIRDAMAEVGKTRAESWRVLELHRRLGDLLVARGNFEEAWEEYEIAYASWFSQPTVGRPLEKERLIFESILAFWKQAAVAGSPLASEEKHLEWQRKLQEWESAQPPVPSARDQSPRREVP